MDVSCPQCRTEYEFEDARIPDDGLTVKCTQCSHVFRMKKRAPPPAVPGAADEGREWRLRQPSGNVFTFKHLTTLQKWIVERKVQKQDEISLTGEGWKRLGDIAELASFFQVVDDAVRLAAAANQPRLTVEPPPPPPPPEQPRPQPPEAPTRTRQSDTLPQPTFAAPIPPPPPPPQVPVPARVSNDTIRGLREHLPPPPPAGVPPPPPPPTRRPTGAVRSAYRQEDEVKLKGQGGGLKWFALALVILGAGGAGGYYFVTIWQPEQIKLAEERERARNVAEQARVDAERQVAQKKIEEAAAKARADQEAAAIAAAAAKADAGPADAGVAVAVVDAGVPKAKPMTYEQLLVAAERLRSRDKAEQALAMFMRAAELEPDRVEPQAGGGFCMLDLEKPEQAELAFKDALQLNGRYGPALIGLAEASKALGKKQQALVNYQKYLEVLPNGPEAEVAKNSIERLK